MPDVQAGSVFFYFGIKKDPYKKDTAIDLKSSFAFLIDNLLAFLIKAPFL
jgi:hypothetical protein